MILKPIFFLCIIDIFDMIGFKKYSFETIIKLKKKCDKFDVNAKNQFCVSKSYNRGNPMIDPTQHFKVKFFLLNIKLFSNKLVIDFMQHKNCRNVLLLYNICNTDNNENSV